MNAGIYLGPKKSRWRHVGSLLFAVAGVLTLVHGLERFRARQELARLAGALEGLNEELAASASSASLQQDRAVLWRLRAVTESDATETVPPTEVLKLLEQTLPDRVALEAVSLDPVPPRASLTIQARAERSADVTELQKTVASSPQVAATQLLEERRSPDGVLTIRLQVDLTGRRP